MSLSEITREFYAARDAFNPEDQASIVRWQEALDAARANGAAVFIGETAADCYIEGETEPASRRRGRPRKDVAPVADDEAPAVIENVALEDTDGGAL